MALVVASAVKESVKQKEMQTSSDFYAALDKKVEELIAQAAQRAKGNDRKTVRAGDL